MFYSKLSREYVPYSIFFYKYFSSNSFKYMLHYKVMHYKIVLDFDNCKEKV